MRQHLAEVLLIGLAGGVLGLLLAVGGLAGIRAIYGSDFNHGSYERLTRHRPVVVLVTLGAVAAWPASSPGLYPVVAHRPHRAGRLPQDAVSRRTRPWKSDPS